MLSKTSRFFSFAFKTQLGFRYTLMLVPVTYALVGAAASQTLSRRGLALLALFVASLSLAETSRYWGDPLAFSNVLVQPKVKAYLFLANADIDWNQNRDRWLKLGKATGLPDNGALVQGAALRRRRVPNRPAQAMETESVTEITGPSGGLTGAKTGSLRRGS